MSGTPAWATLAGGLKLWMIMIPLLNKNTAARVASGACRGGKRCRGVSGGPPDRSYILPTGIARIACADHINLMHRLFFSNLLPHRGERMKNHIGGESCRCGVWIFLTKFCFISEIWGKAAIATWAVCIADGAVAWIVTIFLISLG